VRHSHLETYRRCGIRQVITTTPAFNNQSFATNVMEGVLLTLLRQRQLEPTEEHYTVLLKELGWKPGITNLTDAPASAPTPDSPA
jgi:hypothetical protein